MNGQIINLDIKEINKSIYRVFKFQRLLELFASRKNTLVKPALWDDPLENFVLSVAMQAFMDHPHNFDFTVKDRLYGQCWSTKEESDAMWRIYSPEKSGVKVKTTISKLFNSLHNAPEKATGENFIGTVKYLDNEELREKLRNRAWLAREPVDSHSQATSLLFKRREFEHEAEVRVIYVNHDLNYTDKLFPYSIDPDELFDEIQFDPRISQELFYVFKHYLKEKLGYTKLVTRSELYKVPDLIAYLPPDSH